MGTETRHYDVVIAGAGPAGSSLAIRLALQGSRVALVEQKSFPRHKVCGEFISPECLSHFRELGVLDELTATGVELRRTVFYSRKSASVAVPSAWFGQSANALGLSRAGMDHALLERGRGLGVEIFEEHSAVGLVREGDTVSGIRVRNSHGITIEFRAPLTIDATGRSRILARHLESKPRTKADFVAFKTHLTGVSIPDGDCEIYAYRGGYGGCSGVENDRHNLCFIVSAKLAKQYSGDAESIMRNVLFANQRAKDAMQNAVAEEPWLAVAIENYGRFNLAPAKGMIAVGDAAAFIDPFTGSGMLLALECSRIAAAVIEANKGQSFSKIVDAYTSEHTNAFDKRLRVSGLLRNMAFVPFLAESTIKLLSLSKRLTRQIARSTRPSPRNQPLTD